MRPTVGQIGSGYSEIFSEPFGRKDHMYVIGRYFWNAIRQKSIYQASVLTDAGKYFDPVNGTVITNAYNNGIQAGCFISLRVRKVIQKTDSEGKNNGSVKMQALKQPACSLHHLLFDRMACAFAARYPIVPFGKIFKFSGLILHVLDPGI